MSEDTTLAGPGATRLSEVDRAVDGHACTPEVTDGLFAIADLMAGNVALRRALTDPSRSADQRAQLVHSLLDGKTDAGAVDIAAAAARVRWNTGSALAAAVERAAVRSEIHSALEAGVLDQVEDELFHFGRLVDANRDLRAALDNRRTEGESRQELVRDLLRERAHPATSRLAARAASGKHRTFALAVEQYLELAASVRHRMVAKVTVAAPMDAEQTERLKAALSRQQGRQVDVQVIIDPAVIGGVKVELGDDIIDDTVKHRLDDLHRSLG